MRFPIPSIPSFLKGSGNSGWNYRRLNDQEDSGDVEEASGQNERFETSEEQAFSELPMTARLRALRRKGLVPFVFVVLSMVLVVIVVQTRGKGTGGSEEGEPVWDDDSEHIADDTRLQKYQTPSDAAYCLPWPSNSNDDYTSNSKSTTQVSFDIPPDSDLMFFISRGQPTRGQFNINSDRYTRKEKITVNVTAEYDDWRDLEQTKACFVENDTERGIMIWAGDAESSLLATIEVSVEIPWSQFKDFSTDFSGGTYTQNLGSFFDLWDPLGFKTVRLKGNNGAIDSKGIIAESVFFRTTNAPVSGTFFVSEAVHIRTTNGAIEGTVWAVGQSEGAVTEVSMRTTDSPIQVALTMVSDFQVVTLNTTLHTTNGEMIVSMPRMATLRPDYTFILDASTSNAPADVHLSPDYAGSFSLQTDNDGKTQVQWNKDATDPWGKGRKPVLEMEEDSAQRKSGSVYWGDEVPKTMGDVRVRTTERDVRLYLSPA
ncbi:hypothetical protein C8R42DRAFT_408505 [Lentinula raphanica]|nr:hypothetical protein C8R42DRAFT_408505 [Lentinula raphanica]